MDQSNQLTKACEDFEKYPQNIIGHDVLGRHRLQDYVDGLHFRESKLFNEKQASVDILDYNLVKPEPHSKCIRTLNELKELLREVYSENQKEPKCRFIFVHAPHSRAALRISRNMLNFLFSFYQVMPSFLDFIFPFGKQENMKDFHFSGLREDSHIDSRQRGLQIRQLGRSGRDIRLCYNLRSVERSLGQEDLPWSIRQTAVYHSFDLESGQSLWINIKGNKLLKNRLFEASERADTTIMQSISQMFSDSLLTHTLFCDWSGENWRWFINDLEAELHKSSMDTLAAPIDSPSIGLFPPSTRPHTERLSRTNTGQLLSNPTFGSEKLPATYQSRATTLLEHQDAANSITYERNHFDWKHITRGRSRLSQRSFGSFFDRLRNSRLASQRFCSPVTADSNSTMSSPSITNVPQFAQANARMQPPQLPSEAKENLDSNLEQEANPLARFTFGDLQRLQYIEEKVQETLLVLKLNIEVLQELRHVYSSVSGHADFPSEIKSICESNLVKFEKRILGVEKDLRMQQSRTETLLCVLADRKKLLHDILQYRSMKATEACAKKAQTSAIKMEAMTNSMHEIARTTKHETVSMRVITSVTLFFLPGTFVATFMSTDIVRFADRKKDFQAKGLKLYLAICLPMMAITFLAWYLVYQLAKRRDRHAVADDQFSNSV